MKEDRPALTEIEPLREPASFLHEQNTDQSVIVKNRSQSVSLSACDAPTVSTANSKALVREPKQQAKGDANSISSFSFRNISACNGTP